MDGSPTTCDVALGLVGEVGLGIESITTFDLPVFSDLAGRLEEGSVQEMAEALRLEHAGNDPDTYAVREDNEGRHWEIDIKAGAANYKLVSETISLGRKVTGRQTFDRKAVENAVKKCANDMFKVTLTKVDWSTGVGNPGQMDFRVNSDGQVLEQSGLLTSPVETFSVYVNMNYPSSLLGGAFGQVTSGGRTTPGIYEFRNNNLKINQFTNTLFIANNTSQLIANGNSPVGVLGT